MTETHFASNFGDNLQLQNGAIVMMQTFQLQNNVEIMHHRVMLLFHDHSKLFDYKE